MNILFHFIRCITRVAFKHHRSYYCVLLKILSLIFKCDTTITNNANKYSQQHVLRINKYIMRYVSTRGGTHKCSLHAASLLNLPNDQGLFVPQMIPKLNRAQLKRLPPPTAGRLRFGALVDSKQGNPREPQATPISSVRTARRFFAD